MISRRLGAVVAASVLALAAAPAAGASQPYVEPIQLDDQVLAGCAFDIGMAPDGREYMRIFDSGRFTVHSYGRPTLTNLETDESVAYRLRYQFTDAGNGHGQLNGRFLWTIVPGDIGPSGEVDPDGGLIQVVGALGYVADPDTFAITSLTIDGRVTDVCAALS